MSFLLTFMRIQRMHAWCLQGPTEGVRSTRTVVTGVVRHHVDSGSQAWVISRATSDLNHWTSSPTPLWDFFPMCVFFFPLIVSQTTVSLLSMNIPLSKVIWQNPKYDPWVQPVLETCISINGTYFSLRSSRTRMLRLTMTSSSFFLGENAGVSHK